MKLIKAFFQSIVLRLIIIVPTLYSAQTKVFYNVYDYGAKGNGKTLDSKAINITIEEAEKMEAEQYIFPQEIICAVPFI